jgi:hypothetical protein
MPDLLKVRRPQARLPVSIGALPSRVAEISIFLEEFILWHRRVPSDRQKKQIPDEKLLSSRINYHVKRAHHKMSKAERSISKEKIPVPAQKFFYFRE